MSYWMIVERHENWLIDQASGFASFGIPEHKKKLAAEVRRGDIFFTYVSGRSAFADSRTVTADGLKKSKLGGNYETSYAFYVETSPLKILDSSTWPQAADIMPRLSFAKGKSDWRFALRTSIRRLTNEDGHLLELLFTKALQP